MIIVRVELHSAITGQVTELARMHVSNVGGDAQQPYADEHVTDAGLPTEELV